MPSFKARGFHRTGRVQILQQRKITGAGSSGNQRGAQFNGTVHANYEKHTEFDEERKCWICSIYYDKADETELLIDILSFGPVVRVLGPEPFLGLIKARVRRQHRLFQQV